MARTGPPLNIARALTAYVYVVVGGVALLDLATGLYLLASPTPWLAHGPQTVWTEVVPLIETAPPLAAALASLWQRVGAFSCFAGIMTLVWLWRGRRDPSVLRTLLVAYLVAGLAFGLTDARWFSGTPYHLFKQVIGGLWVTALGAHVAAQRTRSRSAAPRSARP